MRNDKNESGQRSEAEVLIAEDTEPPELQAIREKFINEVNRTNEPPNTERGMLQKHGVEAVIKAGNLQPFKVTDRRLPELRAQFKKNPEAIFFEAKENSKLYYLHYQSKNGGIQSGLINPTNLGSSMVYVRAQQLKKVDLEKLSGLQKFVRRLAEGWRDFKERWNIGGEQKWQPELIPLQEDLVRKTSINASSPAKESNAPSPAKESSGDWAHLDTHKQPANQSTQPRDQGKGQETSGPPRKNR